MTRIYTGAWLPKHSIQRKDLSSVNNFAYWEALQEPRALMIPYLDKEVLKLLAHGQFCGCQLTTNFLER
jgi:hypothetical protein